MISGILRSNVERTWRLVPQFKAILEVRLTVEKNFTLRHRESLQKAQFTKNKSLKFKIIVYEHFKNQKSLDTCLLLS